MSQMAWPCHQWLLPVTRRKEEAWWASVINRKKTVTQFSVSVSFCSK